jgi:hypothetical protein
MVRACHLLFFAIHHYYPSCSSHIARIELRSPPSQLFLPSSSWYILKRRRIRNQNPTATRRISVELSFGWAEQQGVFPCIFPTVVFRNHYHNNPSMEEGRKKPLFINNGWGGSGGTRSKKKKREKIDVDVCMYCVCGCVIRILPRQYRRTRFSPLFVVNVVVLFFFYVLLTFFYFYFVFRFNPGSMLFSLLFD